MARNFNGTNQYLSRTATLPSSPLSISVWFKPTVIGSHTVFSFGNLAVNQDRYAVFYFSPGIVVFQVSPGNVVFSSNMVSAGVYNNITTTDDGNTKTLIVNGDIANKVSFNTTQAPTTVNQFALGTLLSGPSTPSNFFQGDIAHTSMWSAVLSDAEITMLNSGVSPLLIRPQSLTHYWPLTNRQSPEVDVVGANNLSLVNAPTIADNPPVIRKSLVKYFSNFVIPQIGIGQSRKNLLFDLDITTAKSRKGMTFELGSAVASIIRSLASVGGGLIGKIKGLIG